MNYTTGDKVHHADSPERTATVVRFPAPFRVVVRWDGTGRESEENGDLMAPHDWKTETLRSGVAMDVHSDDRGTRGVPGTWYRVRQGSKVALTTRNRGDALRLFQRRVRLVSGA
jgi:hypothetical protein